MSGDRECVAVEECLVPVFFRQSKVSAEREEKKPGHSSFWCDGIRVWASVYRAITETGNSVECLFPAIFAFVPYGRLEL